MPCCAASRHGLAVVGDDGTPGRTGRLCQKGWTAAHLLSPGERLTTTLMRERRDGPLRPAGWDEALDRVAAEFRRAQPAHGRDSAGVFGGGGLTNEKAYWLGKFARVALRTASIDYNGRFCMSSAAPASARAFGIDRGLPFPLPDLAGADVILLAGGGALIVIDPRRTPTARLATLHLQGLPGPIRRGVCPGEPCQPRVRSVSSSCGRR